VALLVISQLIQKALEIFKGQIVEVRA